MRFRATKRLSSSAAKALGIDTFIGGTGNNVGGGLFSGPATKPTPTFGIGVSPPTSFSAIDSFGTLGFLAEIGDIGIGIALTALEEKGFSRTLAEPNLVALSGNEATFLAGQEVPIPVRGDDNTIEIEFKPVGVGLNFTPTVLDDDLINLKVSTEVSSIDTTTDGVSIEGTWYRHLHRWHWQ